LLEVARQVDCGVMRDFRSVFLGFTGASILVVGCQAAIPASAPTRASGQSQAFSSTLAGQSCDATNHDRPFVIEWDATDLASFEGRAANDVVFVKYDGCNLEVLDACSDDSVKGAFGAYGPPAWTSGAVEKLDVADRGELYAKLPLAASLLGARIAAGEKFHMEYFVSGVRTSTRATEYRGDLARVPACTKATHFVYAYNLGAFELGTERELGGKIGSDYAGVSRTHASNAVKKGGVLTSCAGDSAKDAATCRIPIRLALRPIEDGQNPKMAEAPPPSSFVARADAIEEATSRRAAAMDKFQSKDGEGCVRELDAADKLDPAPARASTNPKGPLMVRAMCEMLAGKCEKGRHDVRLAEESTHRDWSPAQIDRQVSDLAGQYCRGGGLTLRDQLIAADRSLREASQAKDAPACKKSYEAIERLLPGVASLPGDGQIEYQLSSARHARGLAIDCLAQAGQCGDAVRIDVALTRERLEADPVESRLAPEMRAKILAQRTDRASFDARYPACKGR
jgi:hypothetical protein